MPWEIPVLLDQASLQMAISNMMRHQYLQITRGCDLPPTYDPWRKVECLQNDPTCQIVSRFRLFHKIYPVSLERRGSFFSPGLESIGLHRFSTRSL